MRELKFRAWEIEDKKYYPVIKLRFDSQVGKPDSAELWLSRYANEIADIPEQIELEQYTGLKDKNGKEIYDGDIIQETLGFDVDSIDGTFRYKVIWNEDMLCWSLEYIGNESIHDDLYECNSTVEVIGNIHENPELLEEKNNG